MELSREDIIEILKTVRESGYRYFNLEVGDLKVSLGEQSPPREGAIEESYVPQQRAPLPSSPSMQSQAKTESSPPESTSYEETQHHIVNSPVVGVFYRSPKPGDPPYVQVGDQLKEGDTIGLIEVMKVYNSVAADVSGTVVEFLVDDNAAVEYGQPLLVIKPDEI